jgi:hypothetical protein
MGRAKAKGKGMMESSVTSWGSVGMKHGDSDEKERVNAPVSPSIYSTHRLTTRATPRSSDMTFGSVGMWLDQNNPVERPQTVFTGTPSQMVDAPRPLFARREQVSKDDHGDGDDVLVVGWKGDISAPRPVRPQSADPLGRLSGMGFGLGMR